jgi:hypothetical protein
MALTRCQGQSKRVQAAAGAAEGALGRGRPAASGSRWRRNPARHDFSRSAAVRPISGIAAETRPSQAALTRQATIAAASTATASVVTPGGASNMCQDACQAAHIM